MQSSRRQAALMIAVVVPLAIALAGSAGRARVGGPSQLNPHPGYVPGEVIVGYRDHKEHAKPSIAREGFQQLGPSPSPHTQLLRVPHGVTVGQALAQLRSKPGVAYAVPNLRAHPAGTWIPNDRGLTRSAGGWERLQWNFVSRAGVNAPRAWSNLIAAGHPGGRGVVVAILDTGVAYRKWHEFRRSPDFAGTRFVAPYDFVARNRYPLDREGHGTFVAGTIAEATNNGIGVTGLAYGATLMPVRVLDSQGNGDSVSVSRGIRYAVTHGAQVINLSLEFDWGTTAQQIPDVMSALRFAESHRVVVVAAAGNDSDQTLAYPARAPAVISVGATTRDLCIADYSNDGAQLDLVAPGGGNDSSGIADPHCHPDRNLPDIYQMTFPDPSRPDQFGLPSGWDGTSMASAHVAAAAALVIASHLLGAHPTPAQVLRRLEQTATRLGAVKPNVNYGYGLVNVAAATKPRAHSAKHG